MAVKLSQLSVASVTALLAKLGFGPTRQSILHHYQVADGSNWSLAVNRAIAAGITKILFPEGSYTFSTPIDYVQGLILEGEKEMKTSGVGGSKITANVGFIKNPNTTRKQLVIRNLHIIGNNTAGSVAIDGPFGGTIEGCRFEGFDHCIRNASGYLAQYIRCNFANALFGINTADANGTVIENCHFNADVVTQLTTRDVTPQTGVNSGLPLIIRENNFNAADAVLYCLKVRGQLDIRGNYFEKFNGGAVESRFIDLEVNRFDHQGAIIESNEFNGQSSNATALYINGSHAGLDNFAEGRFSVNRVIGCNQSNAVVYGSNNRIPGFKIYGNFGLAVVNSYQEQHVPTYDGWNYLVLGSDFSTTAATAQNVTGLAFAPVANAIYEIEGQFMVRTATATEAPRPGVTWPTGMSAGVGAIQMSGGTGFAATTPRYGSIAGPIVPATVDVANNTDDFPAMLKATLVAGASPSGNFQVTLQSETAATNVTMKAGSWVKYKRIG